MVIRIVVKKAEGFRESVIGLIGAKKAYPLLLKTRFGIHTFGLSFPIDVVVLNNDQKVVRLHPHMLPNSIYLWLPIYKYVLELPAGSIQKLSIVKGKPLAFDFQSLNSRS